MLKYNDLNSIINTAEYRNINESYMRKFKTPYYETFDIFLCHSSSDIDEIVKLKTYLLRKYNKKAYVCEVDDPQLDPAKANRETAKTLQERMNASSELYFVLSKNTQKSIWMPWELGYFDGTKTNKNIKIFPLIDKVEEEIFNFEGQEYLELYSIFERDESYYKALKFKHSIDKLTRFGVSNHTMRI
ncbi:MAG: toll-Interleukin receptor [Cyanobacteria bacterium SIG28]|nr:toll-Interleukin receptor [Cyanobacteria bacterium SIG28]